MLRQTPNRRHRWLAPANSDLESSYESRPGYHPVEVHTQAGPTQVSLHNQAVEALDAPDATAPTAAGRDDTHATIAPAQLAARATQPEQVESSKLGRKRNLLHWLLWWRIDQDE